MPVMIRPMTRRQASRTRRTPTTLTTIVDGQPVALALDDGQKIDDDVGAAIDRGGGQDQVEDEPDGQILSLRAPLEGRPEKKGQG